MTSSSRWRRFVNSNAFRRSESAQLVEQGVNEAEHDQMLQAARATKDTRSVTRVARNKQVSASVNPILSPSMKKGSFRSPFVSKGLLRCLRCLGLTCCTSSVGPIENREKCD